MFLACTLVYFPSFAKQSIQTIVQNSEISESAQCFFIPPEGWEFADLSTLTPRVKIAFLKRGSKGFSPCINLAIEETQASLSDYLKAVKAIHEQDRNNHWRALGKVRTPAGLAQLTEIDSTTEVGPIRILQLILLKEGRAYVLTAAALKEEISNYYKAFQAAFRSLTLTTDLLDNVPQLERRENLKEKQHQLFIAAKETLKSSSEKKKFLEDASFQKTYWIPFQSTIIENFEDMGAFWQVLILKTTQEKLLSMILPDSETIRQNSTPEIQ